MEIKKNPKADNEQLRIPLVFLGFFIVGSLITLAFSYKESVDIGSIDRAAQSKESIPEELEVIEQETPEDEPVVQEIEDMDVPPEPSEEIEEVKSKDVDEPIKIAPIEIEIKPDPTPAPAAPIVDYPDKEAVFPGGAAAMAKFLSENIKYPEIAMEMGDQGRVFLEFVVNQDGSVEQIKILRGVSRDIDREAERVRARCRIPINFILQ